MTESTRYSNKPCLCVQIVIPTMDYLLKHILMTAELPEEKLCAYRRQISTTAGRLSLQNDITVSITVKSSEAFEKRAAYVPYYMNVVKVGISYAV